MHENTADGFADQMDAVVTHILDKHSPVKTRSKSTPTRRENRWMFQDAVDGKRQLRRLERERQTSKRTESYIAYRKAWRHAKKARWLAGLMTHQYKKLPVTMKMWMQFNLRPGLHSVWMQIKFIFDRPKVFAVLVSWLITRCLSMHTLTLFAKQLIITYVYFTYGKGNHRRHLNHNNGRRSARLLQCHSSRNEII